MASDSQGWRNRLLGRIMPLGSQVLPDAAAGLQYCERCEIGRDVVWSYSFGQWLCGQCVHVLTLRALA